MSIFRLYRLLKETDSSIFTDLSVGSSTIPDFMNNGDDYNTGDNRLTTFFAPIQRRKLKKNKTKDEDEESINSFTFSKKFKPTECEKVFNSCSKKEKDWTYHPTGPKAFDNAEYSFGYKDGNKPIAFIMGHVFADADAIYTTVAVNPKYRRKGLASNLLEELIDAAKKDNFKVIVYRVDKENKNSEAVIKQAGGK